MPGPVIQAPVVSPGTKQGFPQYATISSSISTFQTSKYVSGAILYNVLNLINTALSTMWGALLNGPLPAVDGYNLTRTNAAVLNGPFPTSYNLVTTDGGDAFTVPFKIVEVPYASLPAAPEDGLLCIDSTNNRLVYYSGGNRYYIAGTSF